MMQLPQQPQNDLLERLLGLLPPYVVNVREGADGQTCPHVRYLAVALITRALDEGWGIDRTNGEKPVETWDGWLKLEPPAPGKPLFLQVAKRGGGKLF